MPSFSLSKSPQPAMRRAVLARTSVAIPGLMNQDWPLLLTPGLKAIARESHKNRRGRKILPAEAATMLDA